MQIEGKREPGKPKMTLRTLKERDSRKWKLNEVDLVIGMCENPM